MGDDSAVHVLSVGAAAARLGVSPETLRSWGRRYGLMPSGRTRGGHRRYGASDLARLMRMQRLMGDGLTPAQAAREVLASPDGTDAAGPTPRDGSDAGDAPPRRRPGGPGGRVLAVPGASREVRGLARAASRLDADAIGAVIADFLAHRGALATWDELLRPVLIAAGLRWARTGEGVDVEHLLSEATIEALRAHRACQLRPMPGRPVLLACAPEDLHVLPLHVTAAALAERRVPMRVLGARVPPAALEAAVRRTGASGVLVWRQLADGSETEAVAFPRTRPPVLVVVGGPGWDGVAVPPGTRVARSLTEAIEALCSTPR